MMSDGGHLDLFLLIVNLTDETIDSLCSIIQLSFNRFQRVDFILLHSNGILQLTLTFVQYR